jgi:23S rRNA A1618 N6-methylase RlmF
MEVCTPMKIHIFSKSVLCYLHYRHNIKQSQTSFTCILLNIHRNLKMFQIKIVDRNEIYTHDTNQLFIWWTVLEKSEKKFWIVNDWYSPQSNSRDR